ncbi:TetR/AcrR family transcriptional regulator [Nakamurella sp. PAMC28650]|uniref:TetR/AcrR family transcriptional regulator n=1 Tax=Nakamurella sp. PAMC28650 TaxID=2762325 RepID=UPI00164D420A|nr:TetR/AcrR family transcriptional regulator [Nakamurella sp. PAMC28650]QNK81481.1 TetR/AcrR family transcriptional regulator [Nakamurella sp. PAMC28650]
MPAAAPSGMGRRRAAAKDDGTAAYAERQAEIKTAAADLFKKEGFRGTSIGRIAKALGIDRATLYYYVGSKEELFDDVVSGAVRANVQVAERILEGAGSAPEKIFLLVKSLMDSYAEHYPFLYVFIQENLSHVGERRSDWSREMRELNKRYVDIVEQLIRVGIAEGTIRAVGEPWVMAYGLIGMVGWTNRWFNPEQSSADAVTVGVTFARMLISGIAVLPDLDAPPTVPARRHRAAKR